MRISGSAYVVDLARTTPAPKESGSAVAVQAQKPAGRVISFDRVEISSKARELEKLTQAVAQLPDIRMDRVALAKQNMPGGKYRVDPAVLAQKMMDTFVTR